MLHGEVGWSDFVIIDKMWNGSDSDSIIPLWNKMVQDNSVLTQGFQKSLGQQESETLLKSELW